MNKLLKLEFRRLFMAKALYICLTISVAMLLISAATTKLLLNALSAESIDEMEGLGAMALQAPTSLSLLKGIGSSSLLTILAVFIPLFVTEEYSGDIIKNVYGRGFSRDVIYVSKYLSSLAACMIIILIDAAASLFIGKAFFGEFGTADKNYAASLIAILLLLAAYHAMYFAISVSLRKTGAAIAVSIFAPLLITLLLSLGDAVIKSQKFSLTDYWISGRLTILSSSAVPTKEVLIGVLVGALVLLACGAAGFFLNRKREN